MARRAPCAAQLAVLEKLCFRDAWDASALTGILANPAVGAMGWADRGETVAYLIYLRVADEAEILRIGVPPPQRRSGHAARLLSHFLDWARRAGIARVYLEVRPGNTAALALYRRAGFRHAGKRQKYYRDPVEDALVLEYEVPSATPGG